nr:DUF2812 domain-containing protein [uncultured Flavonifractor sp.]
MKRKWSLFTYPVMDIKAAEAMLNRQAQEGWRLEKIHLGAFASFLPAEKPVCYCIDWYDPNREDGLDYRHLVSDAGWRQVGQLSYWNLYEAPAGTPPIQTDEELEYQRFRKKSLRRMALGWAVCLLCFLLLPLLGAATDWMDTGSPLLYWLWSLSRYNTAALVFLCLPLLLAGGLLWSGRLLLRLAQWKRAAGAGLPFPTPGPKSAMAARLLMVLGHLLIPLFLLALLLDANAGVYPRVYMVGTVIGALLYGLLKQAPAYRRARRGNWLIAGGAAVMLAVSLLPLSGVTRVLCVKPPMSDAPLLPERIKAETRETHATLLAARTEWYEGGPLVEGGFAYGEVEGEAWALPWSWLADRVTEQYLDCMGTAYPAELPGYQDVWLSRASYPAGNTEDLWLIRRGNTVLWVETDMGPLDTQWLDGILARLEEQS